MIYVVSILAILGFSTLLYLGYKKRKRPTPEKIEYIPHVVGLSIFEQELFIALNKTRSGLLKIDEYSTKLAKEHCIYMISDERIKPIYNTTVSGVSHDNFPHRVSEMRKRGAESVGEVVAYGYGTSGGFINGYEMSPGHKKIIENTFYTHVGISVLKNSTGRMYNCMLFTQFKN